MKSTVLIAGVLMASSIAAADEPPVGLFQDDGKTVVYRGWSWSVRGEAGRGWVSLRAGDDEFLHTTPEFGGILYRRDGNWVTRFPSTGNISHDHSVGRFGSVADGVFLLKISPVEDRPAFELYAGFNDPNDYDMVVLLGDDVAAVRVGSISHGRSWLRQVATAGSGTYKGTEMLVVHKSGRGLIVRNTFSRGKDKAGRDLRPEPFTVTTLKDPAGKDRLALVLHCAGMAANPFQFEVETTPCLESFAVAPQYDVKTSLDDQVKGLSVVNGVKNCIYDRDTKIDFGMEFGWLGALCEKPFSGYAELEVVHCLGERHFYQKVDLKDAAPGEDGKVHVKFQPRFHIPGTSEVWCRLVGSDGRLIWVDRYRMAWQWDQYKPNLWVKSDFRQFWTDTLAEMRKVPLEAKTVRVEKLKDHPVLDLYEVTFNSLRGRKIYAMLYVPKAAAAAAAKDGKKLPAIVSSHPGTRGWGINRGPDGLFGSKVRQDLRFVTIVPLIRGYAPDADQPFNPPWWGPLHDRDSYVARDWYCAMVRAIDYLATRGDLVDMDRIVAMGGSQGGCLALVTAALDDRVDWCFADCPSNGQLHEMIDGKYGTFGPTAGQVPPGWKPEQLKDMLSYFDPVNFCPLIRCPAYVGSNIGDLTVHSMGPLAAYHNLTGLKADQKDFYPGQTHFHGSGPGLWQKRTEIFEQIAGPEPKEEKK